MSLSSRIGEAYMALSSEMQAREAQDNMVRGALDSEIARSTANEYELQQQIIAEVGARSFEDSNIRTDFNEGDRLINERLNTLGRIWKSKERHVMTQMLNYQQDVMI